MPRKWLNTLKSKALQPTTDKTWAPELNCLDATGLGLSGCVSLDRFLNLSVLSFLILKIGFILSSP